jgi:hypothetical protein
MMRECHKGPIRVAVGKPAIRSGVLTLEGDEKPFQAADEHG